MSHFDLSIAGATLILKDKYPTQLSTRKIYNASYFHDDRYRHEIANHYRDYKLRPRIRRRRRNVFARLPKIEDYNSNAVRDVLPLAVHHFPRFAEKVYTPRGRQTLCESRPPDETYNATVRRIRAANTCKELKELVQRQLGYVSRNSCQASRSRRKTSSSCCDTITNIGYRGQQRTKNVEEKPDKWYDNNEVQKSNKQPQRQGLRRRSLGNLESVTADYSSKKGCWKPHATADKTNDKFAYYLQLATEHYEQGFLANIKYLESIGERNSIIRRRYSINSKRQYHHEANNNAARTTGTDATNANSRSESVHSNASVSSTTTSTDCQTPTPRVGPAGSFRLSTLLKRIGQKRTFRVGNSRRTFEESTNATNHATNNTTNGTTDWAIRVNITPAIGSSVKSLTELDPAFFHRSSAKTAGALEVSSPQQNRSIMNDYLNANLLQTSSIPTKANKTSNNNGNTNSRNTTVAGHRTHFHELINHLTQLEISDIDLSLPKITLTDCSTNNTASSTTDTTTTDHHQQSKTEPELDQHSALSENLRKQRAGTFVLKQSKFNTSLDIPNEANYHNEARPP